MNADLMAAELFTQSRLTAIIERRERRRARLLREFWVPTMFCADPFSDLTQTERVANTIHEGYVDETRPLPHLDPVKQRVVDDEEANRALRRPYRAPWQHPSRVTSRYLAIRLRNHSNNARVPALMG